ESRRRKKGVNICRNDRQISLRKTTFFLSLGGGQLAPVYPNIADNAKILEVIAGKDENDTTSSYNKIGNYSIKSEIKEKFKIAYFEENLEHEKLDLEIKSKFLETISTLKNCGHMVNSKKFELADYLVPCYYVLTTAEASSNLARYDGIKYAYRASSMEDYFSQISETRSQAFGSEVKRRIMAGTYVLSENVEDDFYKKAQKIRRLIFDETKKIFMDYDFIILPTTPTTAFSFGEKFRDATSMYLEDIFNVQANLSGVPAISIPLGKHSNGSPFGIQIYADSFEEQKLYQFANYLNDKIISNL
ncbi:MAG: hypothetical protein HN704_09005, partial [Bacteroidetes bacterium]|nr:hypothetical protein [Bacteroidota bacterium]